MKKLAIVLLALAVLQSCRAQDFSGPGLEPIPGSITYRGQPREKLTRSPVGSAFPHTFITEDGREAEETYIIQPDRSLKIAHREFRPIFRDR